MATDLKSKSAKAALSAEPTNGHGPFTVRHKVSSLREKRARVRFEYEDDWYEALYNKAAITVGFGRMMQEQEEKSEGEHAVEMLAALLIDWDLVDDDGAPLPLSREELESLPTAFLGKLLNAIWEDYSPGETRADDSGSLS